MCAPFCGEAFYDAIFFRAFQSQTVFICARSETFHSHRHPCIWCAWICIRPFAGTFYLHYFHCFLLHLVSHFTLDVPFRLLLLCSSLFWGPHISLLSVIQQVQTYPLAMSVCWLDMQLLPSIGTLHRHFLPLHPQPGIKLIFNSSEKNNYYASSVRHGTCLRLILNLC